MSLCRVVLVQSCVAGAVTQGVTTRGRDFSSRTMLVFVQRPPSGGRLCQIVLASLHCCTHCWGEKKVDGLILSVGCTNRGKTPITHCYISHDGRKGLLFKKKEEKSWLCGASAVRTVWAGVFWCSFSGETEVWELEVRLGWGTLVCVLAGSLLCVNEAELKESFTERGSVKGMCRMRLGSSNGKDRVNGKKKKYLQMKKLRWWKKNNF